MSKYYYFSLILLTVPLRTYTIWPPPYEIKLNQEETFVISDFVESDNIFNDEDEMIRPSDVKTSKSSNNDKYFRIHQIALRHNKREMKGEKKPLRKFKKIREHNFDLDESVPWEAGFVDKNGNFIQPENQNVYYLNEMAKNLIDSKIEQKREEGNNEKEENYDYNNFKMEYNAEVQKAAKQNDTLNFTDVNEDESLKDAVDAVVDFKEPKNCTEEESRGIGISAIKCIAKDLRTPKSKNATLQLFEKILKICLIWFCVYIVIAVPCWCQRGWCCCCCRCKMCRPRETIDEAKTFFVDNPAGVFHTENGEKVEYEPTNYEIYAQKRLEKALFNL